MIKSNTESENTISVLPYPSLIFQLLQIQKIIMEEREVLEQPWRPIKIFTKLYQGAHILDVDNEVLEKDLDFLVANDVATNASSNVTPFHFLSSQIVQIRKRRLEVVKHLKHIKIEHIQLKNENNEWWPLTFILSPKERRRKLMLHEKNKFF